MSDKDEKLIKSVLESAQYVEMDISDIKPAPYNPRKNLQPEDEEYQQIRRSINEHGLMQPIIYNKRTGNAVGGNQRLKILMNGGVKQATCAVIDCTLEKEKRLNIALNKIGNMWDQPKLRSLMIDLKDTGYDLGLTIFPQEEIESLTQSFDTAIDSFFEDTEEVNTNHKTTIIQYRCPFCGEVFEK